MQPTMLLDVSPKRFSVRKYIYAKKINDVTVESKGGIPEMFMVTINYANNCFYLSELLTDAEAQGLVRAIDERLEYVGNFMSI